MSRTGRNIDESQLSHTKWNCMYHAVFIPKYRRKAIFAKYIKEQETEDIIQDKKSVKEY